MCTQDTNCEHAGKCVCGGCPCNNVTCEQFPDTVTLEQVVTMLESVQPIEYHISDCVYGGSRVWMQRVYDGRVLPTFILDTLNTLSKWNGADKCTRRYYSWEVEDEYLPAIRKFLNRNKCVEVSYTNSGEWLK